MRERTKPAAVFAWRNEVAQPDTKNSRLRRHGELSIINGSSVVDANGDFTCQPHVT